MLAIVLFCAATLGVFLFGVFVIASIVATRHGDPSACYRVYAVRDCLIHAVVFQGVPRDDPWLDSVYENVTSVLIHSSLLGGPRGWPRAVAVGHYQAAHPNSGKKLKPFPASFESCPEPVRALGGELRSALEHLVSNHLGLSLQIDAKEREHRRIQREKARNLLAMMKENAGYEAFATRWTRR